MLAGGAAWFAAAVPHATAASTLQDAAEANERIPELPSLEWVDARVQELKSGGESARVELDVMQAVAASMRQSMAFQAAAEDARKAIEQAPAQLEQVRARLASLQQASDLAEELERTARTMDLSQVQQQATDAVRELGAARDAVAARLASDKRRQEQRQSLPVEVVNLRAGLAKSMAEVRERLVSDPDAKQPVTMAALAATRRTQAELEARQAELDRLTATSDLAMARSQLEQSSVPLAELAASVWQRALDERLRRQSQQQTTEARVVAESVEQADPALKAVAEENVLLGQRLIRAAELTNSALSLTRQSDREAADLQRVFRGEVRRLDLHTGEVVGRQFLRKLAQLRDRGLVERSIRQTRSSILSIGLELIDLGDRLESLRTIDEAAESRLDKVEGLEARQRASLKEAMLPMLEQQRDRFILPLIEAEQRAAAALEQQAAAQQKLVAVMLEYRDFLERNLLTLRTARPMTWSQLPAASGDLVAFITDMERLRGLEDLGAMADESTGTWGLAVLALLLLLLARPWCTRVLQRTGDRVARVVTDRFEETLLAVVATIVLAAPLPAAVWFLVWQIREVSNVSPLMAMAGMILSASLPIIGLFCVVIAVSRRGGLAERHFRSQPEPLRALRRICLGLLLAVPVLMVLAGTSALSVDAQAGAGEASQMAAWLATMAMCGGLGWALNPWRGPAAARMRRERRGLPYRARWIWYPVILVGLLVPAVVAWQGYVFSALIGITKIGASLWVVALATYGQRLLARWLSAASRRIAAQQLTRRREAAVRDGTEGPDPEIDSERVDLAALNEQSRRIIRSGALTAVLLGLIVVWADTLPAFEGLRTVSLWSTLQEQRIPGGDGVHRVAVPTTLLDLLGAVVVLVLTVVVTRNIPGLLELVVLSRLPISKGASYAIVTISRYALATTGGSLLLGMLGVTWENIQWLVGFAVLGLSFGFQEIFKNLVSGVILLVEQPIRVGDVVTVGGITGRVARISMRATTIVDWDRKELVMPNSGFITAPFTNWTLSDSRTRQVIAVGVAYGSDYRLVERVLVEAASADAEVSKDPPPVAVLVGFGDNSVNFEVRMVVDNVDTLPGPTHRVRLAIADALRSQGIEIPFPQRDLHLRSIDEAAAATLRGGVRTAR